MYSACIYTLLKVVGYCDLSVLSMSVMGLKKKVWMGVGGWGGLYPIFFIFGICYLYKAPYNVCFRLTYHTVMTN